MVTFCITQVFFTGSMAFSVVEMIVLHRRGPLAQNVGRRIPAFINTILKHVALQFCFIHVAILFISGMPQNKPGA